jgi:hypothetical protein
MTKTTKLSRGPLPPRTLSVSVTADRRNPLHIGYSSCPWKSASDIKKGQHTLDCRVALEEGPPSGTARRGVSSFLKAIKRTTSKRCYGFHPLRRGLWISLVLHPGVQSCFSTRPLASGRVLMGSDGSGVARPPEPGLLPSFAADGDCPEANLMASAAVSIEKGADLNVQVCAFSIAVAHAHLLLASAIARGAGPMEQAGSPLLRSSNVVRLDRPADLIAAWAASRFSGRF